MSAAAMQRPPHSEAATKKMGISRVKATKIAKLKDTIAVGRGLRGLGVLAGVARGNVMFSTVTVARESAQAAKIIKHSRADANY
jgi:hypothetical protein